jgi:hypothetical protein
MQMIRSPQIIEEVRALTRRIPTLNRIVPIVRICEFFIAINILLYLACFAGPALILCLQLGAQK